MEYLVTQAEMKQYDNNTIEYLKIPAVVLMERAALVSVEALLKEKGDAASKVLVVSGCGNNGGDGLAIGRLLLRRGFTVDFVLLGAYEKCTEETRLQLEILAQYGIKPYDRIPEGEYDIVIDAIFGIGLTRDIEGVYKEAVDAINTLEAYVCAADIPSGVQADDGRIMGTAVCADLTVSYGFLKLGELLYPGAGYCGKIVCGQMGIDEYSFLGKVPGAYTYTSLKDICLPARRPEGNKGTFGKVLVIAGNDTICGAALMAGESALRIGAGMVKMITSIKNRAAIQQRLPEAMVMVYDTALLQKEGADEVFDEIFLEAFRQAHEWADCILIGPGIGTGKEAAWMLRYCMEKSTLPMVIDADALNLLAADGADFKARGREIILTPHLAEFARLFGCSVKEAAAHISDYPQQLADKTGCIVVCKDARTVVAVPGKDMFYLNMSGNPGMATAGSGDVLAGMLTGLIAQGMEAEEAAVSGVYLHGLAGDKAAAHLGQYAMTATDIITGLPEVLKECASKEADVRG
ncbi:MAG: NAD(P)H-hydrate dehydratase [Roseburia sp.]|nr:NAD(P)H-hydrate dehydratase [Roseburia sp.]MCM1241944.1 NAD(P)H-hydrate dehydratase [Roseburia sp.]